MDLAGGIWASGDKLQSLTHMDAREVLGRQRTHPRTRMCVTGGASLRGDNVGKNLPPSPTPRARYRQR